MSIIIEFMKICGLVVEYNPFHNGHIHHINEAKRLTNADYLIAIMSGNFCQRGDISIIDKFEKTRVALEHGINLVIELPFAYTIQNASIFGTKSVEILKLFNIDYLVFGSETNNIDNLKMISETTINIDYLKEIMKTGISYPKAYSLLQGSLYPNDILAISYLKALKGTNIKPISIQRTNEYHSEEISKIASATAIRKAIKENRDYHEATPLNITNPHFNEELYPYLRNILNLNDREDLIKYHLVSEGIEKAFKDSAFKYDKYEDFINSLVNRRYTKARIQRICINILANIKSNEIKELEDDIYAFVLGFDSKGQELLHLINNEDEKIVSNFKKIPLKHRKLEWKSDLLYASLLKEEERKEFLQKVLRGPIRL